VWHYLHDHTVSDFGTIVACDGRMDRQSDGWTFMGHRAGLVAHGEKHRFVCINILVIFVSANTAQLVDIVVAQKQANKAF